MNVAVVVLMILLLAVTATVLSRLVILTRRHCGRPVRLIFEWLLDVIIIAYLFYWVAAVWKRTYG